ncbi:hypothetical protein [Micromonospora zingiberis]|uniref:hypothetical protein n=1 Tax=Micromonospora zingiberis TaxID=2053011 RepID=UPI00197F9866|nr:hypothetical protein [Micromonospora zingiberis]
MGTGCAVRPATFERTVEHPREIASVCAAGPTTTLLTWLRARPGGGFTAAVDTGRAGERLTLPARTVVRVVVPPAIGVVNAGQHLFDWLHRHRLTIAGPTVEDYLTDADGDRVTVLEAPILVDALERAAAPDQGPARQRSAGSAAGHDRQR